MLFELLDLPLLLLTAGLVLMILEAMAPGANFIVLGVALFVAGLLGTLVGGPLAGPIAMAAMVLVFGVAAFYVYREVDFYGSEAGRTSDSNSLRGKTGRVTETVTPTEGEVKLDSGGFNPYYQARSMDGTIEEGEEVMVVDPGGGNVVTVESADGLGTDEIDRALERDRQASDNRDSDRDNSTTERENSTAKHDRNVDLETDGSP